MTQPSDTSFYITLPVQETRRLPPPPKIMDKSTHDPLFLYCNLTKSEYGNNVIMKAVAYDGQKTLIDCNPLQYYSLRSHVLDVVDVTLREWNNTIPEMNQDSPVTVTLFFQKETRTVPKEIQ